MSLSAEQLSLAREWAAQMERWMEQNGLAGWDPFDVKEHPLIRAAQTYPLARKATSALCDLFPVATRRMLGVGKTHNAKAYALVALGRMRRYQATGDIRHWPHAETCLEWLLNNPSPNCSGLAWGYPFDVKGTGVSTPRNTPIVVVASIAGEAFMLARTLDKDARWANAARNIAIFILRDIPRLPGLSSQSHCFAYTPGDVRRVHNANLLAAAHLARVYAVTHEPELLDALLPSVLFALEGQREDGSWPYGECAPNEPFEPALMKIVDHYHTGFVLRSLNEIADVAEQTDALDAPRLREAVRQGFAYYERSLLLPDGTPVAAHGRFPVEIHACAEALICPAMFAAREPGALDLAARSLEWTWRNMRDPQTGFPYHRKYPWFTSKLPCTRWGLAWMYRGVCDFLAAAALAGE